jgi:hypothetical protein
LTLPTADTDDRVLGIVEGEVLGTRFIEELLALVDTTPDPTAHLEAKRQRLVGEIDNLVKSVAKGMPAETIAPVVKCQRVASIEDQQRGRDRIFQHVHRG